MCDFISCWVNENGDIACADPQSHTVTQELLDWDTNECLRWREVEWVAPDPRYLHVRTSPDDDHNCNWYKSIILAKYPTVDLLVDECLRQVAEMTGIVHVSGASWITRIPELPDCTALYCSNCRNLHEIRGLPSCQILQCNNCDSLVELPELPKCRTLSCYRCPNLVSLPELPNCTHLNCNGSGICQLPVALPKCLHLCCSGCKQLTYLPELNTQCCVVSNTAGSR